MSLWGKGRKQNMKFAGGLKHGEDVTNWAKDGRSGVYVEGGSIKNDDDGTWMHTRIRYIRQTWVHRDGRQTPYFAYASIEELDDVETAAQPLMDSNFRTA